jgi:hypothetical protein
MNRSWILLALAALLFVPAAAARAAPVERVPCNPVAPVTVLPVWARGGFSSPRPAMPHVLGRKGLIVAILWAEKDALAAPPRADRNNKVLWVARLPWRYSSLWIRAQRMVGTRNVGAPVSRVLKGGPRPSFVNLPEPGCWRLSLHWSGRHDTVDLGYVANAS